MLDYDLANPNTKATLMQATRFSTALLASLLLSATGSAQVFDAGPSDPSLFTNVFDLPGDDLPEVVGGGDGETTQVNIGSGSTVDTLLVLEDSEINISGGSLGIFSSNREGNEFNISGGSFDRFSSFRAADDTGPQSQVNITGGIFDSFSIARTETQIRGGLFNGRNFSIHDRLSDGNAAGFVELIGGEFRLNGELFTGSDVSLISPSDVFSGTFEDGTPLFSAVILATVWNQ